MQWYLFIDDFTRGKGYQPFETNDIATADWAPASFALDQPYRHGYVIGMYVVPVIAVAAENKTANISFRTAEERARLVG